MTTLFVQNKMVVLSWWLLFIPSQFPHLIISSNIMAEQKVITKLEEVIIITVITVKMKNYDRLHGYQGPSRGICR